MKIDKFKNVEKRGQKQSEDPFNKFLKFLNTRSISFRKHEMGILENLGKHWARKILKIHLIRFENIEYGINIFEKT